MKAVPVPSSSSNLLSSRNQVLESKSLLCYNCFRFQSFMDFLCKDSTTVLHTTVEVVLTFTNVTLNFTTPLNESSAMSYGTLLYTKRRAKRATVAAKKAKQQLFDSHFLCILILMKIQSKPRQNGGLHASGVPWVYKKAKHANKSLAISFYTFFKAGEQSGSHYKSRKHLVILYLSSSLMGEQQINLLGGGNLSSRSIKSVFEEPLSPLFSNRM